MLDGEEFECKALPPEKVWLYFRDVLRGVSYLHSQVLAHGLVFDILVMHG